MATASAIQGRDPSTGKSKRQLYLETFNQLVEERSSWLETWRSLAEYILPWRARFTDTEANKGGRKDEKIVNFAARRAAGVLAAGMMSNITSPARKWFKLSTVNPDLAEVPQVRTWLALVEQRIFEILLRSNIYACLHNVYLDLGTPGTAVLYVEEDAEDIVRGYVYLTGSYALANSARLSVNVLCRQFRMTNAQVVEKFGLERCSVQVQTDYKNNQRQKWVRVLHCIEPNEARDPRYIDNRNMPVRSVWMEMDQPTNAEIGFLRESGYEEFPAMCPRWAAAGEDVYGSDSPGQVSLGEVRALQVLKKEKLKGVEKMISPPMKAPASLRNERVSFIAGDVTFGDSNSTHDKLEPAQTVDPRAINEIRIEEQEAVAAINAAYFANLFLSISQIERSNTTAEEIRARKQEALTQLGPVLDRLNDELLDPLIDRIFGIALRAKVIPLPPEELNGEHLKVEYLSSLGQAQKALGLASKTELLGAVKNIAEVDASILDKVDFDHWLDGFNDMLGGDPDDLLGDEEVAKIRADRAQAAAQRAQVEQAAIAAKGAKDLSGADLEGDNALKRILSVTGPMAPATGGAPALAAGVSPTGGAP